VARTSMALLPPLAGAAALLALGGMAAEEPSRGELAELVIDHVLGDVDRHVPATVVDADRVADHLGEDGAVARPRLDDAALTGAIQLHDVLVNRGVDVRPLLRRSAHPATASPLLTSPPTPPLRGEGSVLPLSGAEGGWEERFLRHRWPRRLTMYWLLFLFL